MKKIFILMIMASCITSCSLDRQPNTFYTEEKVYNDKAASAEILLNGCYSELATWTNVMHRLGEYTGDNVSQGQETDYDFGSLISYTHNPDNASLSSFWVRSYGIIEQTTTLIRILKEESQSPQISQGLGEAYYLRGMVYFYLCRTFGRPYYQSPEVNLGVPIISFTKINVNDMHFPDRSTVKEIYTQAINDLTKAESLMTIKKKAVYATKEAAQAMLSRMYLYMSGTYQNPNVEYANLSIQYANKVISSGNYRLLSRVNFMKYNILAPDDAQQTETIFATKRVASDYVSGYFSTIGADYATILGQGSGIIYASEKYLDLLRKAGGSKDARWAFIQPQYVEDQITKKKNEAFRFIYDVYDAGGKQTGYDYLQAPLQHNEDGSFYVTIESEKHELKVVDAAENKYAIEYKGKTYVGQKDYEIQLMGNYPMYYILKCSLQNNTVHLHSPIISRLAEMYLNLAEAYAKKGDYQNAKINLNTIRERAVPGGGYTSLNSNNATQLIDEERQLELAFEAHRGYDVYRNGQTLTRRYPGMHPAMVDIPPTNNNIVQYIPQSEINAYPGTLTQNP